MDAINANRLRAEALLLGRRFRGVRCGTGGLDGGGWVLIPTFDLPLGWNRTQTSLLIPIPTSYPFEPPHSFYLPRGLAGPSGRTAALHYFEGRERGQLDFERLGWAWYCYHVVPGAWQPTVWPTHGDNLLTYANIVYQALAGKVESPPVTARP